MGPGVRKLARVGLKYRLLQRVADAGLVLDGEVLELTQYDEQRRSVLLVVEARALLP